MPSQKLTEIEKERGALDKVIPTLLRANDGSQKRVARELGLSPATVSTWLKENGYVRKSIWVKEN